MEFAGKLLRIRRERKQRDRCCAAIEHKKKSIKRQAFERVVELVPVVKSSIPEARSPVLVNFRNRLPDPTYRPWVSEDGKSYHNRYN